MTSQNTSEIQVLPATAKRWDDLETLFGPRGAYSNCWCTYWRLKRAVFNRMKGEEKKAILKDLTCRDQVPGVLAYLDQQPIGWCSIGPRQGFASLERSTTLKRVDDQPVWSIVCFYVGKSYRRQGFMLALLQGALRYAAEQGAKIVEGYPIDIESTRFAGQTLQGDTGYMGISTVFRKAGFVEVGRASEKQLIMRYLLSAEAEELR
jgi:GNAT superfamily N-acetyltransferase